jgi:pimeloyl-ACP methyl ester carboxylesterase
VQTVLLHALPLDGSMWTDVEPTLRGPVFAPTLYGLGETIEEWASAIVAMTGNGPLAVVGNSIGGSCAVEIARLAPDRVKLIVLIGAKPGHRPEPAFRDEALAALARGGMAECWPRYWEPLIAPNASPSVVDRLRTIAFAQDVDDLARGVRVFHGRPDRGAFLHEWNGPVQVVGGDADPIAAAHTAASTLPSATYQWMAGVGHYVPVEAPTRLATLLRKAIADL